jgi:nucleotidyltransferase/DNA polymerase involved in DNA repair
LAPLQELKAIWGVGPVTAQKWIGMGIKSIKQLRAAEKRQEYNLLTRNQSTGELSSNILKHKYNELLY